MPTARMYHSRSLSHMLPHVSDNIGLLTAAFCEKYGEDLIKSEIPIPA